MFAQLLVNVLQIDFTSNSREQINDFTILLSSWNGDFIDCFDRAHRSNWLYFQLDNFQTPKEYGMEIKFIKWIHNQPLVLEQRYLDLDEWEVLNDDVSNLFDHVKRFSCLHAQIVYRCQLCESLLLNPFDVMIYDLFEHTFKNHWELGTLARVLVVDGTQCKIWPVHDCQSCLSGRIEVITILVQVNDESIIDRRNQLGEEALEFFLVLGGALYFKWHFRIVDMLKQEQILFDGRNQIRAEYDGLNLLDVPKGATSFLLKWREWHVDQLMKMLAFQVLACLHFVALDISKERS